MKYLNQNGELVEMETKTKKKKVKIKDNDLIGKSVTYIGLTKDTGSRIVCYEGLIEIQDHPINPKVVGVLFTDNYVLTRGKQIRVNIDKKYLKFN